MLGVKIVAVSVDSPENLAAVKAKIGADFSLLSDAEGKLLDTFGLRHVGGNPMDGTDMSRPAIIVVKADGTVVWSDVATNYRVRPKPKAIAEALKTALAKNG